MRQLLGSLAISLLLAALPAAAKDLTPDELRALQGKMKSWDTLTVDFTQTTVTGLRHKSSVRQGKALFTKPDSFKWMFETPTKQFLIFDGKYFFDYDPQSNSARRYSPTGPHAYEMRQIIDMVLNFDALLKRYDPVKASDTDDLITTELKPKTPGDINAVTVKMDKKESAVTSIKLEFKNKTTIAYDFRNISHKPIAETAFVLPKDVKFTDSN